MCQVLIKLYIFVSILTFRRRIVVTDLTIKREWVNSRSFIKGKKNQGTQEDKSATGREGIERGHRRKWYWVTENSSDRENNEINKKNFPV